MGTSKFFIGAIVKPNKEADETYNLTNSHNIKYARVTSVRDDKISISVLKYAPNGWKIDSEWDDLLASCFDLVEDSFSFVVTSFPNDEGTEAIFYSSNPRFFEETSFSSHVETITDFQNMIYKAAQNLPIKEKSPKEN